MTAFLFGPLGYMQELDGVQAGVTRVIDRPRGEMVTVGGVRYTQKAKHAPRTWGVGYVWQSPTALRLLTAAAHGAVRDCWLYDVAGARANMLPPHQASGAGNPVVVGGIPLGAITSGQVTKVPVLAGRIYTVSAWSAHIAGVAAFSYQVDAGAVANAAAPTGAGVRVTSASITPTTDAILTVTVGSGADVSGLRIHEGSPDGEWHPGHGTPCRVDVIDPSATLQLVTAREALADYTVTLQEVGIPGVI